MNKLFSVIPENFFIPLSSQNRIVYWECICKLFSVMNHQLSFGIERDVLADELQYYFEQSLAADLEEEDFRDADSRGKANLMLRKLENYGWIEIETDKSYIQKVNFREHAIQIIKTLLEVEEGKQIEYQGYIYTIYSLVRSSTDHSGVVLTQILDNTDMLITGLKNMSSNIKHYIDGLTKHRTVAEIMDVLFNDYITNIVDKAYHRLLTSDNVSKFRPEIIERLESKSKNIKYMTETSEEISRLKEIPIEEARELVYRYLHEIIDAFRNMDDILNEINQKNAVYQRAAINRAKFLLAGSEDIRGQLKEILLGINEVINQEQMELDGIYEIGFLEELIRIYSSAFLDDNSFYSPVEGKKAFEPQEIPMYEPDLEKRQEKLRKITEKMQKILSQEKIDYYIKEQLGGRGEMLASELPLENIEDFVKIIYVRLYGQRKNMCYQVEVKHEKVKQEKVKQEKVKQEKALQKKVQAGFRFKDYLIRRK